MGVRLGRYTMDPQAWIRTQAGLQPRKTVAYLVSLYNGSYWVPWIQQYGDGKMKLFSGWDEESNPTFTFAAKGDVDKPGREDVAPQLPKEAEADVPVGDDNSDLPTKGLEQALGSSGTLLDFGTDNWEASAFGL